jgi:hypothetical protein
MAPNAGYVIAGYLVTALALGGYTLRPGPPSAGSRRSRTGVATADEISGIQDGFGAPGSARPDQVPSAAARASAMRSLAVWRSTPNGAASR